MKKNLCCLLLFVFICSFGLPIACAESDQWKSRTYDFDKIKTIVIIPPLVEPSVNNPYAFLKTSEVQIDYLNKKKIKYMELTDLQNKVSQDSGQSMTDLEKSDPKEYLRIMSEKGSKYVDAVLILNIFAYGWSSEKVEGYYHARTTTQTGTFSGTIGMTPVSGTASGPVTTYNYVPGGNMDVASVGCMMSLYDAQTLKPIWSFSDVRSKDTRAIGFLGANFGINRFIKNKPNIDHMMSDSICDIIDKLPIKKNKE